MCACVVCPWAYLSCSSWMWLPILWFGRFMKLRLDRVLSDSYEADTLEEALASNPTTIEFEKPENWVAPYPKYEYGWWEAFLPAESRESKV